MKAKITGIGHYLPNKIVTNDTLASEYDITGGAERIFQKTGIRQRHYLETASTSKLVIIAIKDLIGNNRYKLNDLDSLILGTTTPNYFFPATATAVLNELNAKNAFGFDVSAACSGFMYALHLGRLMKESGEAKKIIVCGGDKMSSTLNGNDYKTAVLFGDGAGAVMLEAADENEDNYLHKSICSMKKDGLSEVYLKTGLNSKHKTLDTIHMDGRRVYESGVSQMPKSITVYLKIMSLTLDDIDYIVPHQSNLRMLEAVADKLGLSMDKILTNIETMGNTGSATTPVSPTTTHLPPAPDAPRLDHVAVLDHAAASAELFRELIKRRSVHSQLRRLALLPGLAREMGAGVGGRSAGAGDEHPQPARDRSATIYPSGPM